MPPCTSRPYFRRPDVGSDANDLTFFLDENISRRIAQAMTALGHRFEHLLDYFPQGTADVDFLPAIAAKGWILVTQDQRIPSLPTYVRHGARKELE